MTVKSNDPTYDLEKIKADAVWHIAWILSELDNDNAPIGWSLWIPLAREVTAASSVYAQELAKVGGLWGTTQ